MYFDLYLNKTNPNDDLINNHKNSYLSIAASSSFIQNQNHKASYEYNLTNLASNTQYIFYLSARLDSIESSLAGPLIIQTPSMSLYLQYIFKKSQKLVKLN